MTAFARKEVAKIETLGEKLRRSRGEARLSLETVAQESGIQPKYLQALEMGRYDLLPGEVYVRSFLHRYAALLQVSSPRVMELYERERAILRNVGPKGTPPQATTEAHSLNLPRAFKRGGIALAASGLLAYLGMTVFRLISPPELTVLSPSQDFITNESSIQVHGQTEGESVVHINGQEVLTDPTGNFTERIDLQPGLNVIKITSNKERSREQVIYRQVIVQEDERS